MKNSIIGLLILALLGLGAWVAYDKIKPNPNASGSTQANGTNATGSAEKPKSANTLDLNNKGLSKLGPEVYNRTDVTELILSNNNLQTLPSEMGKMAKLEILRLDHNRLDGSLIGEIRKMPLKTLDVSYNNMTGMPAEIGQLNKLETLNYSYNKLTGLPNELANLKNTLKVFNLTGNPISQSTQDKLKAQLPNTNIIF